MSKAAPKICFIAHDASRTGAPIGLLAFMRWLRTHARCDLGMVLRSPGPLEPELRELGPTLTLGATWLTQTRTGRRLGRFLPDDVTAESGKIRSFFAAGGYDLIYSNTITNGSILATLAAAGVPVITHVHELDYWIERSGPQNLQQVVANTTAFIAASEAVRENLIRRHRVPAAKIKVVYEHIRELPAVPTPAQRAAAREQLKIPAGALVVGGCGAEHWRKGRDLIPQLLLALRRLSPGREVHFVWVGRPGTAEEEYMLAHDLRAAGLTANFHNSGEVKDPFQLFPAMDIFALLSREDPYPLACLEVAATETPVVCFADAGGMPEFARGECGLVSPYLDMEIMAQDILRLASDPELYRRCGQNARAKVTRENLLDATGPQLYDVIKASLNLKPASGNYERA